MCECVCGWVFILSSSFFVIGNLNLSFLMHRSRYDRRRNLSLVVTALTSHWDLDIDLNNRDDLILDGVYKVRL